MEMLEPLNSCEEANLLGEAKTAVGASGCRHGDICVMYVCDMCVCCMMCDMCVYMSVGGML